MTTTRRLAAVFPAASADVLDEAAAATRTVRYRRGDVVVTEGETADRFYAVLRGHADVVRTGPGLGVHLDSYGPGSCFGEVALLNGGARTATVRAVTDLRLLAVEGDAFRRIVASSTGSASYWDQVIQTRTTPRVGRGDDVPLPPWSRLLARVFKHPRAMHYNRLIAAVLVVNAAVLVIALTRWHWWHGHAIALATTAQVNFAVAVIVRQQYVINALAWLATRPPTTWPLRIRWALGKYYHFGGLHVGAALAGTGWYLCLVASLTAASIRGNHAVSGATLALSYVIVATFLTIVVLAHPRLRATAHDRFEITHRFLGWLSLLLVWANTLVIGTSPATWVLVATSIAAVWPWLLLRKVPITVTRPSAHAAVAHFDHGVTPPIGSARAVSRHPLLGWHYFANVPAKAGEPGYRMVISRAGDWTSEFIDNPPDHVWVRGIPALGVATARRLFRKVLFVATGSGIGPMLGHLLVREPPSRLLWVTKTPRATYGDLIDEILAAQPDATIWNTDELGKPDVLRLAYREFVDSGAEAVIVIANRKVTWQIVHGLELRGIPAFGPIWDS